MKRYYTLDDTEELESLYIPKILFDENSKYFNMSLDNYNKALNIDKNEIIVGNKKIRGWLPGRNTIYSQPRKQKKKENGD